jgi:hypothetical protein
MKFILLILVILFAGAQSFASEFAIGYIYQDWRNATFFAGFESKGGKTGFPIYFERKVKRISEHDYQKAFSCMKLKHTHALKMTTISTGIIPDPDMYTDDDFKTYFIKVECIPAPGLLEKWRAQFRIPEYGPKR